MNTRELICPNCHKVFKVDEADYAAILSQVKNKEFNAELEQRLHEVAQKQELQQKADSLRTEQDFQKQLASKDTELGKRDAEIAQLKEQMKSLSQKAELDYSKKLSDKELVIADLRSQISKSDSEKQVAILKEQDKAKDTIKQKESEIASLTAQLDSQKKEAELKANDAKMNFQQQLKEKDDQISYLKDMKVKLSTKMIGESLEVHCSTLYNTTLRPMLPNAYFEKDNDASEGSKGDFIFRDYDGDMEYVSIMFEMKNELENGGKKHKNEDFFNKLDSDRRKKNCEYAVLVSLLEPESELYNSGIVDVSHKYPKMYVIRPQFFIPIITLLVQTSKKSIEYKHQLEEARNHDVDVTNFETKLGQFKDTFTRHFNMAAKKYEDAINDIDATIKKLQKVREDLVSSENNLRLANKDTDDLTIRKLTYKNPTMKAKFDEARNN